MLSGALFHPSKTIGWIGGTFFFYIPPHNNREVPMYFLRKLYAEFVMGKHVNYFDMLGFQGVGRGMPQHRPHARHRDANPQIPIPRSQLPRIDIPPAHDMVA